VRRILKQSKNAGNKTTIDKSFKQVVLAECFQTVALNLSLKTQCSFGAK
jgi:hypothetical protein